MPRIIPTTIGVSVSPAWIGDQPSPELAVERNAEQQPAESAEEGQDDGDAAEVGAVGEQ
jgi:hypothetical protein